MMQKNKLMVRFFISIGFVSSLIFAQESDLTLKAHYKEKVEERIYATGNVEITYKNLKLFADTVELNTETKDVVAEGNVIIQMPQEVISAEKISFNLDSREGILEKAHGMAKPYVFYEAESIERKEDSVYQFKKTRITSCTQAVPRWWFSGSKANFKKNDYIEMWNAVLRIKNIPVFYFPYIKFPVGDEKATGLLTPQMGYSGRKGLTYSQGFYWDIRRNMDATLNFDYYSFRGFGGGLEYRYMFPRGTGGKLNLYYFNFKPLPEEEGAVETEEEEFLNSAYILRFKHNQPLPFDFKLVADVDYQSAFDFLREFDNNVQRALIANRSSQVYISRAWSYFNANVRLGRFETYYRLLDRTLIRKSFPEIGFSSSKINIIGPVHFSFSSSFKHWEFGFQDAYEKGNQKKGDNLSLRPAITIPFTAIPWMTLNPFFSSNFVYYFQSYAPGRRTVVDDPLLQKNFTFSSEFIGPVFNKIFFNKKNEPVLKHIIEPSVSYRYESPVAISDRIITATGYFFRYHYLKYGLTNRILVKKNDMAREVFALGVNQTYYLEAEESPLQRYLFEGEIPAFSDINGYLRFYPSNKYSFDFSTRFNPYYKSFSSLNVGANLGKPDDDLFLRVNWYKSSDPYRPKYIYANRHQLGVFGGVKIPWVGLEAKAQVDYNFAEKKMLYSAFKLEYHYQCFDFEADLKMFFFREKPEMQFRITIGLGNIGKTTDFLGGMGF
jgi:lipopolysaccharide assembly outer membrane protein LptD (OstA)